MKKIFNTFMLLALGCIAVFADNKLYISDMEVVPGQEKTVEVVLDNADVISSLQFDVTLPDGLTFVDGSVARATDRITRSSHSVLAVKQESGAYRFGILSTSSTSENSAIQGKKGTVLTFAVKVERRFKNDVIVVSNVIGSDQTQAVPAKVEMEDSETKVKAYVGSLGIQEESYTLYAGMQSVVNVTLKNKVDLVGLQAVVTLPKGFSFVKGDEVVYTDRLSDNVIVDVVRVPETENTYTLLVSSITNDAFEGSEGVLLGLNVISDATAEKGSIEISDITVSTAFGDAYVLDGPVASGISSIADPTGNSIWDIDDAYYIYELMLDSSYDSNADVDGNGVVDIDDAYKVYVNMKK